MDDGFGKDSAWASIGLLPPSIVVEQPRQALEPGERKFIFYNGPCSEAPSALIFYLPVLKAFNAAKMMSQTLHKLYTLPRAKVRDDLKWARHLETSQEWAKDTDVLFNQHHWPVWDKERMAASIDGTKAAEMLMTINVVLSDDDESHVLCPENGVLHHRKPPASGRRQCHINASPANNDRPNGCQGLAPVRSNKNRCQYARYRSLPGACRDSPGNCPIGIRELND